MPEILINHSNQLCQRLQKYCGECAKIGSTDCINHGGLPSADSSVLGTCPGDDAFRDHCRFRRDDRKALKPSTKREDHHALNMPEMLKSRNHVSQRLQDFCQDSANIDSRDCIHRGVPPFEDSSVPSRKRLGEDSFEENVRHGRDDWMKRPNSSSSSFAIPSPPPKLVSPSKPAASSFAIPSPPKLVPPSVPAASSFAIPSPPPKLVPPSVPAASLPTNAAAAAAPIAEAPRTPPPRPNILSDHCSEQASAEQDNDDPCCKEGGVRFRENLGKYVVEYRPPRFKWKLWMGTYATQEEGRRACDCARFYAGQDKGGFYFKDSPALFAELGPLTRPFSLVSKDVKDKAFNVELKKRAKLVIRKVLDAQKVRQSVDVTRPLEAIIQRVLSVRTNAGSLQVLDRLPTSSQESQISIAITDPAQEENELAEGSPEEVMSAELEAGDLFADLDPLPDPPISSFEFSPYSWVFPVFVSGFNMTADIQYPASVGIQSSLDFADDPEGYVELELWKHEC